MFGYKKIDQTNFQGQAFIKSGDGKDILNLVSERAVYLTVAILILLCYPYLLKLIYEHAKGIFTMKTTMSLLCLISIFLSLVGCQEAKGTKDITTSTSALKLPALFSDHMVLQQKLSCPVWGWAKDGTQVTAEINGKKVKATARDGRWQVQLPAMEAGGPYTLTISTSDKTIELKDVLAGEVWVCSG